MPSVRARLMHAWNAFFGRDAPSVNYGPSSSSRPDKSRLSRGNARSIVAALYNRIAMDAAAVEIRHVKLDSIGRYKETVHSKLNNCLTVEANIDQTSRAFMQDIYMSLFDEGCVAIVPVETTLNPNSTDGYDVKSLRTGKITQWFPKHVKVLLYNEATGRKEEIIVPKKLACIIENPFYSVMNEPNSTLQRLQRKLVLLDTVDEATSSGKLNMIIQLPYTLKSPLRQKQAQLRRKEIQEQLSEDNPFGIAYTEATEKITQINRPLENNLLEQIEYLTKVLYSQLGLTDAVFNGTASEEQMLDYNNRTIEPLLSAVSNEIERKLLSQTARTQGHAIRFFRDPFRLTPVNNLADIADKFTRNEILSSNEFRAILGYIPSDDPRADQLINKNMPVQDTGENPQPGDDISENQPFGDTGYEIQASGITSLLKKDHLEHHGIKGQRWGVKNGPPYPLSEEKSGKVRMNATHYNDLDPGSEQMTKAQKGRGTQSFSDIPKMPKQLSEMSEDERLQRLRDINHDPSDDSSGRDYNCPNCASAFDMVKRGYDVRSRPAKPGSNVGDIEKNYIGGHLSRMDNKFEPKHPAGTEEAWGEYIDASEASASKMNDTLKKEPVGSWGIVVVGWIADDDDASKRTDCYHAINYERTEDGVMYYDTQSYRDFKCGGSTNYSRFMYGCDPRELYFMRTDNLEPSDRIMNAVETRGRK